MARTRPFYSRCKRESDNEDNANVDGSVTTQIFKVEATAGWNAKLSRMIVQIGDSGALSADEYGNIAALANGVDIGLFNKDDDSLILDLLDGAFIKNNGDWSRHCYDMKPDDFGTGLNFISARWTFEKDGQRLTLDDHTYFGIRINDNLTGLVAHYFEVRGTEIKQSI